MNQINKPKKGFSLLQMHSQPTNYNIRKCHLLMTYENSKTGSPSSLSFVDAINFWENPELHIIYIKVCCKFPTILSYDTRHNLQNNYSVWSLSEVAAAVTHIPSPELTFTFFWRRSHLILAPAESHVCCKLQLGLLRTARPVWRCLSWNLYSQCVLIFFCFCSFSDARSWTNTHYCCCNTGPLSRIDSHFLLKTKSFDTSNSWTRCLLQVTVMRITHSTTRLTILKPVPSMCVDLFCFITLSFS